MRAKRLAVAAVLGGIVAAAGCETCRSCQKKSADKEYVPGVTGTGDGPPGLYGAAPPVSVAPAQPMPATPR